MNLLFDKQTNKLVAFSENDLSDQVGDLYILHNTNIEINSEDISGYSLVNNSVQYVETDEHKAEIAEREAKASIPSRAELLEMIKELQKRTA